jgi:cell division septation protein DedD
LPEYMTSRRQDDAESFFCRFTFGQFFAILVLEVFTLFFVFYLGARYGRGLLGLDKAPAIALEEAAQSAEAAGQAGQGGGRVITTSDPEAAKVAGELMAKADTPELKERIRRMIAEAQGEGARSMPEVISVDRGGPAEQAPPAPAARTPQTGEQPVAAAETPEDEEPPLPAASPKADAGVVRVKSGADAKYAVQVGSYPDMAEATRAVERWKSKGYPAYLMIADIPDRGKWYRVRIGGFASREDASRYQSDFSSRENVEALVVLNEQ